MILIHFTVRSSKYNYIDRLILTLCQIVPFQFHDIHTLATFLCNVSYCHQQHAHAHNLSSHHDWERIGIPITFSHLSSNNGNALC